MRQLNMSILPGEHYTEENRPSTLQTSIAVLQWIHFRLDGLRIDRLAQNKRIQLASGCWHIAIEHSQAIVVLIDQGLHGSALAMQRPLIEAYARGLWLMYCASDADVDAAGRDQFPGINRLTKDLERPGASDWVGIKDMWWSRLCSFTHTGYQQIGARLTAEGLGYAYDDGEISQALG
ncbi:MAG TPA: hypothetical protein VJV97_07785 [Gemmatimonadaceae bacterium]|nr:hypothetical protein [Gemmatimonadaceae bacterium]